MKPPANKVLCVIGALLVLIPLAMIPLPTEGKEQIVPEVKPLPTLIDFGRGTCTPCKMMKPMLDGLKQEYSGSLNVVIIDVRYDQEALKKYKVPGVPFQLVFDASGKELTRHYGYMDKDEILKMLKSVGIELKKVSTGQIKK